MDLTQIVLGVVLLAVSTLTFVGPSVLGSTPLIYVMTGAALMIGASALLVTVASDHLTA